MKKLYAWILRLFKKSTSYVHKHIEPCIQVVEFIKGAVDSDFTPLLTALIPGQVDDLICQKLKTLLPFVLLQLKISDECTKYTDADQVIQCAIRHLKSYSPLAQRAYYLNIATMLSEALTDGKLSWGEIVHLVQFTYTKKYEK